MSEIRWYQTSTLLPDGTVLVTGGRLNHSSTSGWDADTLNDTEIYDPVADLWTPAASMSDVREYHTATLLTNGLVLVTGGRDTAELYDPSTGTWRATGTMTVARWVHSATLLPNGKVLVVGGAQNSTPAYAEIYDPVTEKWKATSASGINPTRWSHTATLLPNGKVLITGGAIFPNGVYQVISTTHLYDPATDKWIKSAPLSGPRWFHTATLLPSGLVLVAGGSIGGLPEAGDWPDTDSVELYDPATDRWSPAAPMHTKRGAHSASLLPGGRVLVAGGGGSLKDGTNIRPLSDAEIFNPQDNTWTEISPIHMARYYHTATTLADGRVLLAGGSDDTSAELYQPDTIVALRLDLDPVQGIANLSVEGPIGVQYRLEYTDSLSEPAWKSLIQFEIATNPFNISDAAFSTSVHRFYRVREVATAPAKRVRPDL